MASGDRDLPFIPILSNIASSSNSHSTRSIDRTGRSRRHPSSNEDREAKEISQLLLKFTEQIQLEKRRADEAERKTREITEHLRSVNHARLLALQDAQRANEELKLYKIQLRLAQREVNRAQDVLQVVDRQRHQAEKEAAKTRSRFRQLNEDMLVHQAREEGRRMGIQEGLARGRDLVFQENRTLTSFAEDDSQDIEDTDEDYDLDSIDQSHSSVSDIANDDVDFQSRPPSTFERIRPTTPPLPIPVPRQEPIPVPPSVVRSSPRPVETVPPVSIRGVTPSPRRPNVPIPPDNFIPHLDPDNILRMPPPFEFQRATTPERPQTPSVTGRESDEPLMIPGPRAISSQNRHYPRPSSPESNSTTISQFEMVNEPYLSTLRTPMSVIPEVQSDQSSPTPQSINDHRDLRHQRSSGSHASRQGHPAANLTNGDRSKQATHSRRRSNGSVSAPLQTMPPSIYQRHKSSLSSGSLPSIDIQPPSRPVSHISQDLNPSRQLRRSNSPQFTTGSSSTVTTTNQEAEKPMPGNYSPYVKSQESGGPPPVIPDPKLYGPDSDDDAVSSAQSYTDTLTTPPPSNGRNESAWNAGLALSGQVPLFSSSVTSKGAPLGKAGTTRKTRT